MSDDQNFMQQALAQAKLAYDLGEVPIGSVIVKDNQVIAAAYNQVETSKDATCHAELLAIKQASKLLNKWRLEDCDLYVTLEPCPMCFGAIRLARIRKLVVGALESRFGVISKFPELLKDSNLGPLPEIITDVMKDECRDLMKDFFSKLRI